MKKRRKKVENVDVIHVMKEPRRRESRAMASERRQTDVREERTKRKREEESYYENHLCLLPETINGFHNNLSSCTYVVSPVKQKNTIHKWSQDFIDFLRYSLIKHKYHSYSNTNYNYTSINPPSPSHPKF